MGAGRNRLSLNSLELPDAYHIKVESLRDLVGHADREMRPPSG